MNINSTRLPIGVTLTVILLCILPLILNQFGIDFASKQHGISSLTGSNYSEYTLFATLYEALSGSFTHVILEWSATVIALLTVILAFVHYNINKNFSIPVIGIAILFAGSMDAFHAIASINFTHNITNDYTDLMAFTWVLSRSFNAIILIAGILMCFKLCNKENNTNIATIIFISLVFAIIAHNTTYLTVNTLELPHTIYELTFFKRPLDVIPLLLFLIAALICIRFYEYFPNILSHALIISMIPNIAAQCYMVFSSTMLFDNAFNIAHILKIIAYLIPFIGLTMDYGRVHQNQKRILKTLENVTTKLEKENTERQNIEIQLKEINSNLHSAKKTAEDAQKKAEISNRTKSAFLANMSHEIRTPLNAIIGMTELLAHTNLDEKQFRYASNIHSSGDMLVTLINDILDISKIEVGELHLENIAFDLRNTAREIHEIFSPQAEDKGLSLDIRYAPNLPHCFEGDPLRIRQILLNLIGNALKFTHEGTISLNISQTNNKHEKPIIRFEVEDTGIGIPKNQQKKIFEKFSQANVSTTRKYGGTGLGLAICKELVEMMQGTIGVTSTENKGSNFWFEIPLDIHEIHLKNYPSDNYEELKNSKILIIDNDPFNRKSLETCLKEWQVDYKSNEVDDNILKILKSADKKQEAFDIVIIHCDANYKKSLEIAKKIKKDPVTKDYILLLLSSDKTLKYDDFKNIAPSAHLSKPFIPTDLYDAIAFVWKKRYVDS